MIYEKPISEVELHADFFRSSWEGEVDEFEF